MMWLVSEMIRTNCPVERGCESVGRMRVRKSDLHGGQVPIRWEGLAPIGGAVRLAASSALWVSGARLVFGRSRTRKLGYRDRHFSGGALIKSVDLVTVSAGR